MILKRRQFLVYLAAACIASVGPCAILLAWRLPVQTPPPNPSPPVNGATASAPAAPPVPSLDLPELQQLCARDLRRPFSADATAPAVPTGAPLTIQLVAIANEPGHSMAMFRKSDGTTAICALGDSVDDVGGPATVTRIDLDRISLRYVGTVRELAMPRTPAPEGIEP